MTDDGWERRMSQRTRRRERDVLDERRRQFLGEAFLPFWPPDDPWPFGASEEILPQVVAAWCLGISYGDPGPPLGPEACRECWGDRHVWLGNCWGLRHRGGTMSGCGHSCHEGEVWLAGAPAAVGAPAPASSGTADPVAPVTPGVARDHSGVTAV